MKDCGIVYVAVDPESSPSPFKFNSSKKRILNYVLRSINSLKKSNPNLNITVFSDFEQILNSGSSEYQSIPIKNDYGFLPKVSGILNSPYERTIFLDCDTYVNQDISSLFNPSDNHDICIAREFLNQNILNTGVIYFNNSSSRVQSFFKIWHEYMIHTKLEAINSHKAFSNKTPDDQGQFNEIYRLGFKDPKFFPQRIKKIIELSKSLSFDLLDSNVWNCRHAEYKKLKKENWDFSETKIFHMRGSFLK